MSNSKNDFDPDEWSRLSVKNVDQMTEHERACLAVLMNDPDTAMKWAVDHGMTNDDVEIPFFDGLWEHDYGFPTIVPN
jgi:hypothetical protein